MKSLRLSIRIITQNPKLQSSRAEKVEADYFISHIVGFVALPNAQPGEPLTQMLTTMGPVDIFESKQTCLERYKLAEGTRVKN